MTNELITMQYVDQIFDRIRMSKTGWKANFCNSSEVIGYKEAMVEALIYSGINDHEAVAEGIRKAITDPSDFMPSVGKFVKWCVIDKKPSIKYYTAPKSESVSLEHHDRLTEMSKNLLESMK